MSNVNRPLSPHLQIYDLTRFSSAMSTLQRLSGVFLGAGLLLLTWWLSMTAAGSAGWHKANHIFHNAFIVLLMFFWTGLLLLHFCNGLRYLFWDIGRGFELPVAKKTARWAAIAAIGMNIVLWIALAFV